MYADENGAKTILVPEAGFGMTLNLICRRTRKKISKLEDVTLFPYKL